MENKQLTLTNFSVPTDKLKVQHGKTTLVVVGDASVWVSNKFIRKSFTEGMMSVAIATELDYSVSKKNVDGEYITDENGHSPKVEGAKLLLAFEKAYPKTNQVNLDLYAG